MAADRPSQLLQLWQRPLEEGSKGPATQQRSPALAEATKDQDVRLFFQRYKDSS